jgi:hypothetical protein
MLDELPASEQERWGEKIDRDSAADRLDFLSREAER